MISLILSNWRLLSFVGIAVLSFGAGWYFSSEIHENDLLKLTAEYNEVARVSKEKADSERRELEKNIAKIDSENHKKLMEKENEIASLRSAVASGAKRVRVNAVCSNPGNKDGTSRSPGVGAGKSAELARENEQDFFDLLKDLERMEAQLLACQSILKDERK